VQESENKYIISTKGKVRQKFTFSGPSSGYSSTFRSQLQQIFFLKKEKAKTVSHNKTNLENYIDVKGTK
jgi:hypothetical protein